MRAASKFIDDTTMLQLRSSTLQKFLIWTFVLLLLNLHVNAQNKFELTKKLNCRKFIFAPRCRGVAAKRSVAIATSYPPVNPQMADERNYINGNHDSAIREILLNYILSRLEARSLIENGDNTNSAEDLTSYR